MRWLSRLMPKTRKPAGILVEQRHVQSQDGKYPIRLKIYRRRDRHQSTPETAEPGLTPALVWIHGGGYIIGAPEQSEAYIYQLIQELAMVVVSVDYRLAPDAPFPAPLEDCYTALRWACDHARELGIDPNRIAIGGDSAGGGLAAALAQLACDRGEVRPGFQLLVYPMLDDRTVLQAEVKNREYMSWSPESNRLGWECYLGQAPGLEAAAPYSVPARRADCSGLPPAWIGVGTLDLFYEEDIAYAQKLKDCGVDCELVCVPGAFHGFDVFNHGLPVVQAFHQSQVAALKKYLCAD